MEVLKKNNDKRSFFIGELLDLIENQLQQSVYVIEPYEERLKAPPGTPEYTTLQWTGKDVEWVELMKALYLSGCFNHGEITFKELFRSFSDLANIYVEYPHIVYRKMRERVDNRTIFLSSLALLIEQDMEKKDNR